MQLVTNENSTMVKSITPAKLVNTNDKHRNPKEALGYDLITVQALRKLLRKAMMKLTHLFNAVLHLRYVSM